VTHYSFPFAHEGIDYEIISVVVSDDGGHNYLTRRSVGQLVFSAKDEDQNGTLDTVLVGNISLDEANDIYLDGIDQARSLGRYREEQDPYLFEYWIGGVTYAIHSFNVGTDRHYNTLTFPDVVGREVICVDDGADGNLDRFKKGFGDLKASQDLYSSILSEGVRQGRIVVVGGSYVVRDRPI
jgi:hypothetical protein